MWLLHRSKVIIFFVLVFTTIDFTDAEEPDPNVSEEPEGEPDRGVSINATNMTYGALLDVKRLPDPNYKHKMDYWKSMIQAHGFLKHSGTEGEIIRTCYSIGITYTGALTDLRRFYEMRYFYENTYEFEVGYLVNEIVSKYTRILEILLNVDIYYLQWKHLNLMPSSLMFYYYTNAVELSSAIIHLCNMLINLDKKYQLKPDTGFSDYHLEKKKKYVGDEGAKNQRALETYQKMLLAEKKKREKERRKLRQKNLFLGFKPTPPPRRIKKKSHWPIDYGWSIERW